MDNERIGKRIAAMRRERGFTQENFAELLGVSPQAVSKWENGRSLPETALLPALAKTLETSVDALLTDNNVQILTAVYGDGIESCGVANRLNRLIENDVLEIDVNNAALACPLVNNRPKFLIVKYATERGAYYAFAPENSRFILNAESAGYPVPAETSEHEGAGALKKTGVHEENGAFEKTGASEQAEAQIVAAAYGASGKQSDVMYKIEHYKVFNWREYSADHETFPSAPSSDDKEYLTFVYFSRDGIRLVTCEEGESIAYSDDKTELYRKRHTGEYYIPGVPALPEWGKGHECSWAAALTAALQAMGADISYERVMGVSGACYRLAFCSPGWDYSSVDGLVAYDYATPGFKAFGYNEERYGHVEKSDRVACRERMMKDIRNHMPILGINLRVAAEWGVVCGYKNNGADLLCRTKYDAEVINAPDYIKGKYNPYDYLLMDNWPFLISYFNGKFAPPSDAENFINSMKIFVDCANLNESCGYKTGFKAYETWRADLLDDEWYDNNDDEQVARRFSVNQFCTLALFDARSSAYTYINESIGLIPGQSHVITRIASLFRQISESAGKIHKLLDSGEYLEGERARRFWTKEMRREQAALLSVMLEAEREASALAQNILHEISPT